MNTTTTTDLALSAENLKALRNADNICFQMQEDRAFITARKTLDPKDGFGAREISVEVPADYRVRAYMSDGTSIQSDPVDAFTSVASAKHDGRWLTAVKTLKVGDRLLLRWEHDTHQNLRETGFVVTNFTLEVIRTVGKDGREQRLHYLLDVAVSKAGSGWPLRF
jgi:hypothetical protein